MFGEPRSIDMSIGDNGVVTFTFVSEQGIMTTEPIRLVGEGGGGTVVIRRQLPITNSGKEPQGKKKDG